MNIPKKLMLVWLALLVLLLASWGVARIDLGAANTAIALSIAGVKTFLVLLIFMQVRRGSQSVKIFAAAGFFWFLIMITLTLGDYFTRGEVRTPGNVVSQVQR